MENNNEEKTEVVPFVDDFVTLPPPYNADPDRYYRIKSGAIRDRVLRQIVANPGGGQYRITADASRQFIKERKLRATVSQMRGLAKSQGIELPEGAQLEEMADAAGGAIEAITEHMANTFKKSSNLRGMGEVYGKLLSPFIVEGGTQAEEKTEAESLLVQLGKEAVEHLLRRAKEARAANAE